ncbi:MAG: hypothetical protein EP335_10775 [Alphaproteobacteria bacterium]|nr:MAG: hypothetical protein EP335_10775 [Alphaproteobacteria bacterium]
MLRIILVTLSLALAIESNPAAKAQELVTFCSNYHFKTELFVRPNKDGFNPDSPDCQQGVRNLISFEPFDFSPPAGASIRFFPRLTIDAFLKSAAREGLPEDWELRPWRKIVSRSLDVPGGLVTEILYKNENESQYVLHQTPEGVLAIQVWLTRHAKQGVDVTSYRDAVLGSVFPLGPDYLAVTKAQHDKAVAPIIPPKKKLPKTYEQAVAYLVAALSEQDVQALKKMPEDDWPLLHIGYGTYIRNSLGLWAGDSPIARYFQERCVFHPEEMSSFLIPGVIARVKGNPLPPGPARPKHKGKCDTGEKP